MSIKSNRESGPFRGLILDYGEVICRKPTAVNFDRMARAVSMDPATFAARYGHERNPYDRGDLSSFEYWSRVVDGATSLDSELVDQLRRWDIELWNDIDPEPIAWLRRARAAGLKTALLSNMHHDMAVYGRQFFSWLGELDAVVLSCDLHIIKPSSGIYTHCLEELGLEPSEACFIDDREANVAGAQAVGLTAVRYEGLASLRHQLAEIWFPVLPASLAA